LDVAVRVRGHGEDAAIRKAFAPTNVPRLISVALRGWVGGGHDVGGHRGVAERDRLAQVPHSHEPRQVARTPRPVRLPHLARASALATKTQTGPSASRVQTSRWALGRRPGGPQGVEQRMLLALGRDVYVTTPPSGRRPSRRDEQTWSRGIDAFPRDALREAARCPAGARSRSRTCHLVFSSGSDESARPATWTS
jgi:hypothetical protein